MSEVVRSQYRIPKDLNDWLTTRADEQTRSKNAQLVVELRARMEVATGSKLLASAILDGTVKRLRGS
jgi:hypothetical protein